MLNVLRHKGVAKKVLWFVTIIIVLSFGFFGVANRIDHSINIAGKMYGKGVSIRDYEKAYYDNRDEAIRAFGDQFAKYAYRMDLESQTWDRLLVLHEAKKRGIKASDQEIVDYIASQPYFLTNGKFDQMKYEAIVQSQQYFDRKIHDFEEGIRSQIMIKKLLEQVSGPSVISDEELKKEYTLRSEKIKLTYALFEPLNASKDIKITDEEIKKYYDTNKEQFRKPTTINVEYAVVNFPAKATDSQKEAVKKQIQTLANELKTGSDFKELCQKHKIEFKESGHFSQNQPLLTFAWSPDLVEKLFTMKQGDMSPALETPDGWEILKLKERKESFIPEFDQIKNDVRTAQLTDKGFTLALNKANSAIKDIQEGIKQNKNFKELAEAQGAKVEQTPLFGRGEFIANMGLIAEFQEITLKMNMQNRLSDVISTSKGPAIIYLDSIEPIDEKQFEAEKENFKQMTLAQRRNQAIVSFITKLKIEANIENLVNRNKTK